MTDPQADVSALSFEEAMAELEQIVRRLETGEDSLDLAIAAFERGARLRAHCEAKLQDARLKVDRITRTADGGVAATPMDDPQ